MCADRYFTAGDKLGDYVILEEIGRGGMGVVYLCQHDYLKKRFAVKVMPRSLSERSEFSNLFQQEAQTLGNLKHPNIVEVHNFGVEDGAQFLVMEYIEGGTIEGYLANCGGQMPSNEVQATLQSVVEGLKHAHDKGIIHRDLKPENFLLDLDGTVKISDFGLAQLMDTDFVDESGTVVAPALDPTKTNQTMVFLAEGQAQTGKFTGGTEGYMAPEVAAGSTGDKRADFYAVGVIAYYLLTGERPGNPPCHVSDVVKGLDKRWNPLVERCLKQEPDDRYQSADDLLADITELGVQKTSKKGPVLFAVILAALAAVATFAGVQHVSEQKAQEEADRKATQAKAEAEAAAKATQTNSKPKPRQWHLSNNSFEQGLVGWQARGDADISQAMQRKRAKDGQSVARITSQQSSTRTAIYRSIPLKPGDRVLIEAWARTESLYADAFRAQLMLKAIDKKGKVFKELGTSVHGTHPSWQPLHLDLLIPSAKDWPNYKEAELELSLLKRGEGLATAYFDKVQVRIIKPGDSRHKYKDLLARVFPDSKPKPKPQIKPQDKPKVAAQKPSSQSGSSSKPPPEKSAPKPKPKPDELPLEEGLSQLTLKVVDANDGRELAPGEYMLTLNGKAFKPLEGTKSYRFTADRDIRFEVTADGYKPWAPPKAKVASNRKVSHTVELERE